MRPLPKAGTKLRAVYDFVADSERPVTVHDVRRALQAKLFSPERLKGGTKFLHSELYRLRDRGFIEAVPHPFKKYKGKSRYGAMGPFSVTVYQIPEDREV